MKDIIVVTNAEYVEAYTLALTFSDGVTAAIDFTKWIRTYPFFEPLKDLDYFKNFSVDGWTVVWPNGADVGPETLHKLAIKSLESQPA